LVSLVDMDINITIAMDESFTFAVSFAALPINTARLLIAIHSHILLTRSSSLCLVVSARRVTIRTCPRHCWHGLRGGALGSTAAEWKIILLYGGDAVRDGPSVLVAEGIPNGGRIDLGCG
jgi:hypothetical protein